ncbi:MAG: excinuclease ABC subunit UvrC [Magnetococcales bacterium]|nr:excinuclease ABC subunit UvrC [Magnetococcales bacterium]
MERPISEAVTPPGEEGEEHPLKATAAELPLLPGVYRFLDREGKPLYVGKAKQLRKRVLSYFRGGDAPSPAIPARIRVMLGQAVGLEIAVTDSENDALVLEANLIRALKPRYNVLLKDDKSFPFLRLTTDHPFPRLDLYRGSRREGGRFFGPYPSVVAVRETLRWLQRIFPIRQCEDGEFSRRQRPCLQFQIGRCAAPCCQRIDAEAYGQVIREVTLFLEGRDHQLVAGLRQSMWHAAEARRFEEAARLRDRITAVEHVQERRRLAPNLPADSRGDLDVIAISQGEGRSAIQVFYIRGGINLGNRGFFPDNTDGVGAEEVLRAFLTQYYPRDPSRIPPRILLDRPLADAEWLAETLGALRTAKVELHAPQRGGLRQLVTMAKSNADESLHRLLSGRESQRRLLAELGELLGMEHPPERIEVYDISHIQDSHPVGSLIVFGPQGFIPAGYRRFSLEGESAADDTARMASVLGRRFAHLRDEPEAAHGEAEWPDLILLDGGRGQLNAVLEVAHDLGISGLALAALAKGPERNAGRERLFLLGVEEPVILPETSPLLFLLQKIRDEAHRFAVGYHRLRRQKAARRSALDEIPGIGPQRKKALLKQLGSVRAIRESTPEDLTRIAGIPPKLATLILQTLNEET